jgi:hypothetical protein
MHMGVDEAWRDDAVWQVLHFDIGVAGFELVGQQVVIAHHLHHLPTLLIRAYDEQTVFL